MSSQAPKPEVGGKTFKTMLGKILLVRCHHYHIILIIKQGMITKQSSKPRERDNIHFFEKTVSWVGCPVNGLSKGSMKESPPLQRPAHLGQVVVVFIPPHLPRDIDNSQTTRAPPCLLASHPLCPNPRPSSKERPFSTPLQVIPQFCWTCSRAAASGRLVGRSRKGRFFLLLDAAILLRWMLTLRYRFSGPPDP
jgi:hypothetical protein